MTPLWCGVDIFGASKNAPHLPRDICSFLALDDGRFSEKSRLNLKHQPEFRGVLEEAAASRCFVPEAPSPTARMGAASICRLSEVLQTRLANETFNYISTSFLFE